MRSKSAKTFAIPYYNQHKLTIFRKTILLQYIFSLSIYLFFSFSFFHLNTYTHRERQMHKHIHLKLSLVMRNPLFAVKLIQISECVCVSVTQSYSLSEKNSSNRGKENRRRWRNNNILTVSEDKLRVIVVISSYILKGVLY